MLKNEQICRLIFEKLTKKKFYNCRPTFLNGLEYDGFNNTLKMAFEYNGIQHYQFHEKFHKTFRDYEKQVLNDIRKIKLSNENGIKLCIIPFYITNKELHIKQFLDKYKLFCPTDK